MQETTFGCVEILKQWTELSSFSILFDSTVDEFTANEFFNKIVNKENIALIAFTTDGDVFGCFFHVALTEQHRGFDDPNVFVFSFESHGRCSTPQRFLPRDENEALAVWCMPDRDFGWFVEIDGAMQACVCFGNEMSILSCFNLSHMFDGMQDTTLTGNQDPERFSCHRLIAVHFEASIHSVVR